VSIKTSGPHATLERGGPSPRAVPPLAHGREIPASARNPSSPRTASRVGLDGLGARVLRSQVTGEVLGKNSQVLYTLRDDLCLHDLSPFLAAPWVWWHPLSTLYGV
jgi:hypothetical protein